MSLWQRITAPLRRSVSNAVRPDDPTTYFMWLQADQPAGVTITSDNVLQLSVAWACIMGITTAIASCRWDVFALKSSKTRAREFLPDDPLDEILNLRANEEMTAIAVKEVILISALTWGNGYAEIQRTGAGKVAALWPLRPDRIFPRREGTAPYRLYYEYQESNGGATRLEQEDVFHLKGPSITGMMGDNLVARGARALSLAAAQERFASTYFGNNTVVGGVLEHPGKLSTAQVKELKTEFTDNYGGPYKSNRPVVLQNGMTWKPMTTDADKSQLVQSREFQLEDICRIWNVPPHKVQHLARATFNNIEHLGIEFVRDALTPWALRLKQEADWKLLSRRGPPRETQLDMGWLTRGDFKTRMEGYQIGRRTGIYSINEVRHLEGQNEIGPEGDTRIVEKNMQTLEQLENPPQPLAIKAPGAPDGPEDEQPEGDESDGAGGSGNGGDGTGFQPGNLVREGIALLFASTLDRYQRRLANREADLKRGGANETKAAAHLADERIKLRPWLETETEEARALLARAAPAASDIEIAVALAADAIDNGQDARAAAEALVSKFMEASC